MQFKSFLLFVLAFALQSAAGQEKPTQNRSAEDALGESLAAAIASKDIVAYSQCWISTRQMLTLNKTLGMEEVSAPELADYHWRRNVNIAGSFEKIQTLIEELKIDRKSIRLKQCTPNGIMNIKMQGGILTRSTRFHVLLSVGEAEWRFDIDDGVLDHGVWYFSDSPKTIIAGERTLTFN